MSARPRNPEDLKTLSLEQLLHLSEDLRQKILSVCLKNGGHLGASLGCVELAIALHYVFESPKDTLVWDVGHQAYAHKLLTGRWDSFDTLRLTGGISGFLNREESVHDSFGAGHSSTALSAALGMAWAKHREKDLSWTVAIVGDGGMTAGLALEALNNASTLALSPFLLILNDNQMSISENIGAISQFLGAGAAQDFFSLFGFDYVGPVDGNNLEILLGTLRGVVQNPPKKLIVLHVLTQKGKGYLPAEESPANYHGVSPVPAKVFGAAEKKPQRTYSEAFGEALCRLAESDEKIVAISAAMPEGTGLSAFARRFPDRFIDVGIAEPHAVTFAAGLATRGFKPVVAIYSTFLQRAIDEMIHDVALQELGVTFAVDRAGLVGADGPTHHGAFDLVYGSMIPELAVHTPSCLGDLEPLLSAAIGSGRPALIRYPRGSGPETLEPKPEGGLRWHSKKDDPKAILVALGTLASNAITMAKSKAFEKVTVVSCISAKPVPVELIRYLDLFPAAPILFAEDGSARGGFAEHLLSCLKPRSGRRFIAGYPDEFIPHGSPAELQDKVGLSVTAMSKTLQELMK